MNSPARHYGLTPAQFKQLPLADRMSLLDSFRKQLSKPMRFFLDMDKATVVRNPCPSSSELNTENCQLTYSISGTSILIDCETMDTAPGSIITSIAAIAFTRSDLTVIDHLDMVPDFFEQMALGRTASADTIAFHRRNKTLPSTDIAAQIPCIEAVVSLAAFTRHHQPHRVWIQGPDFDRPLIEDLCKSLNQPLPWHFTKSRDARTAYDLAFPGKKHPSRPHKALEDCQETLVDLAEALTAINRLHAI